jgi:hypothetical protein
MNIAERNRLIKKILTKSFGTGVTVRGSRGTAYGWVTVKIPYAPRDREHRRQIEALIWKLFDRDGIKIGTYGYDDPSSDYGYGKKIHFDFLPCVYDGPYERDPAITAHESMLDYNAAHGIDG